MKGNIFFICFLFLIFSCSKKHLDVTWGCYDYYYDSVSLDPGALIYVKIDNSSKDTIILLTGKSYCSYDYKDVVGDAEFEAYFLIINNNDSIYFDDGCNNPFKVINPSSSITIPLYLAKISRTLDEDEIYDSVDSILKNGRMLYKYPEVVLSSFTKWRNYKDIEWSKINSSENNNCYHANNKNKSKEYIRMEEELEQLIKESGVRPQE